MWRVLGVGQVTAETTLPPMPLDKALRAQLANAGKKVQQWTVSRDMLIQQAIGAGASLREVGEAVGLSHTAVKFIAHGRPTLYEAGG